MASDVVRDGVLAINKPCGMSSAQVLRECQKHFNPSALFRPMLDAERAKRLKEAGGQFRRRRDEKRAAQVKIGHGGTLDPLATGVLILGIGSATKLLPQFLDCTKTYETIVLFGASTDTYDRAGRLLTRRPYDHITRDMVDKELGGFRGKQKQMPPLYSALKMDGKPLYEYAREGKPIPREIEARDVDALEVKLLEWYEPGMHNYHWPTDEAEAVERNLAEQVWRVERLQVTAKVLTPEQKEDDQAIAEHETFKRKFEERQDELITDKPHKRCRHGKEPMMSGALGALPHPVHSSKGLHLVPPSPAKNTPPLWDDDGPPACKVRLTVSSGYYVRSFSHDLGNKLGSAAFMAELCRVRQSDFTVDGTNTLEFDELAEGEEVWGPRVADMLARWNGEPEGYWRGASSPASRPNRTPDRSPPATRHGQTRSGQHEPSPSPRRHDQKHPSPSPVRSPSRWPERQQLPPKTDRTSTKPGLASGSSQRRTDEKSWKGTED